MNRGKVISLDRLTRSHCSEIDQMLAGIRGDEGSTLWTAELRAAMRGGKPCGLSRVKDMSAADSKD
jgi:hypothetical protein